jgi:hypothetical protein
MVATTKQADGYSDEQRLTSETDRLRFAQLCMQLNAYHISNLQLQRDIIQSTQLQLNRQLQILETGFADTSYSLRILHADMYNLQHIMQPMVSHTSYLANLPGLQSSIERMVLTPLPYTCGTDTS